MHREASGPPEGFVTVQRGPTTAIVRAELLEPLDGARLLDDARAAGAPDAAAPGLTNPAGGRGGVVSVELPGGPSVFVRAYRRGGWVARFVERRYLAGDRAFDELRVTERLRDRGVPVPEVLAAVQTRFGPVYEAAIITRREPGRSLAAALADETVDPALTLAAAGDVIGRLHVAGGWHADLNAHNLLVDDDGGAPRVVIIDLDRARLVSGPLPRIPATLNLRRLRRSFRRLGLERGLAGWPSLREAYEARQRG